MADLLFTVHGHPRDEEVLIDALRELANSAIHVRIQSIHGNDFSDASTAEKVSGTLDRLAIELIAGEQELETLTAAIRDCRRSYAVRWRAVPVMASGRFA